MAAVSITGSGHNSEITLKMIHDGGNSFKRDTATTHSQVKLMQQALTSIGYDTQGADGKFGANTESAVKAFQSACGLDADGCFGKRSLEELESRIGRHLDPDNCTSSSGGTTGTEALRKGDSGERVKALQNRLNELLYYCGTADGSYGESTYLAVKYFQERNELSVDGIAGSGTLGKLNSASPVKGVSSSIINWKAQQEPVTFYQNRGFWADYPYDAKNTTEVEIMAKAACGPTSMAVVASTLLGKAIIPPIMANLALSMGYRNHNGYGTDEDFFPACAKRFGLTYGGRYESKSRSTFEKVKSWCQNGGLVIINVKEASPYTNGGHFNVCYKVENDKVYIKDVNYDKRNEPHHTISEWINTSNGQWFDELHLIKR